MRQAMTIKTRIGKVLEQDYVVIFEHNHSQISLGGRIIYDGDEQRGYAWLDDEIQRSREIAERIGLEFEVIE